MRTNGARKKKLIVAFQFRTANRAAWKCDTCRAQRLDIKRRCAWLKEDLLPPERVVWAGRSIHTTQCPKSLITSDSIDWMERHYLGRMFGFADLFSMPARTVEAFLLIETELASEKQDGDQ